MIQLSSLEILLGGGIVSLFSGVTAAGAAWLMTGKHKVNDDDCAQFRDRIEEFHRTGCPISRRVLTKDDHQAICADRMTPLSKEVSETKQAVRDLHLKVDKLIERAL